jgi:hypothetical protein
VAILAGGIALFMFTPQAAQMAANAAMASFREG